MARNMKAANGTAFAKLLAFASKGGYPVADAKSPRWIATEQPEREFLIRATLVNQLRISGGKLVAAFEHDADLYFFLVGFQDLDDFRPSEQIELNGAHWTALLSECDSTPTATPAEVNNIIGGTDKNSPGYAGHEHTAIAALFPPTICLKNQTPKDDFYKNVFSACLHESALNHSWMSAATAEKLQTLASANFSLLPFKGLCRSVCDNDPASTFMSLYRGLETLFPYPGVDRFIAKLGMTASPPKVYRTLFDELSWRPREEQCLRDVVEGSAEATLKELATKLSFDGSMSSSPDAAVSAAAQIYRVRNALVHFRGVDETPDFDFDTWNEICVRMTELVYNAHAKWTSLLGGA